VESLLAAASETLKSWLLMIGGGAAAILGVWLVLESALLGSFVVLMGIGLLLVGAFFDRMESWSFGVHGIAAKVFDRPHGRELIEAAADAPDSALEAVIPLLREDAASDVLVLPDAFDGKRLIDPELQFIRQELDITVFAVLRPGDEKWAGGGRVSTTLLPRGTKLAVIGEGASIEILRQRMGG
jgi:hypothetical protein